jgi:hypothetical protein
MECIEFLLKNPLFSGKIEYQPRQDFSPSGGRVYSEWIASDGAWDLQVRNPAILLRLQLNAHLDCFRADFHTTQPSLVSPYHLTKPNSAS